MDEREPSIGTVNAIDALERHGLLQITKLIDGNHLDEARKVADILKAVGVV